MLVVKQCEYICDNDKLFWMLMRAKTDNGLGEEGIQWQIR